MFIKVYQLGEDLLMATALHPYFKLGVVGYISPGLKEVIRERAIKEVMNKVDPVVDAVEWSSRRD